MSEGGRKALRVARHRGHGVAGDKTASAPSPEDLSTGPILRWIEFDPDVDRPGTLFTTGDGRVVIGGQSSEAEPYFVVTADGTNWSELHLPDRAGSPSTAMESASTCSRKLPPMAPSPTAHSRRPMSR